MRAARARSRRGSPARGRIIPPCDPPAARGQLGCLLVVDFLALPPRTTKPRQQGLTHVIDTGLSTVEAEGLMKSAADYVELIKEALEAGAEQVICEGRESGDAGMYRPSGEPRTGLIDEIMHEVDSAKLIFEAPRKPQQVWFIERLGPEVNLGNVPPHEVISLETVRVGLRADTLKLFHGAARRGE